MRVITRRRLDAFGEKHPGAKQPLDRWYQVASKARWADLHDVRRIFPHADVVRVASGRPVTVFNVAGNRYRLVTAIHYNAGRVYVLRIMTHAEYDKGAWKDTL